MVLIEWNDQFELGIARMDASHQEFIELLNRLHGASDEIFSSLFDRLHEHTEQHFSQEDRWMMESGFLPISIHREEHERVLQVLRDAKQQVRMGDLAAGRNLVKELLPWFELHAASMDTALARHIEATGYVPI